MLKQLTLAAFALTSVAAFAGEDWSSFDPLTASTHDLKKFVLKHAYKTNPSDAYTLETYFNRIPSNVENAILKGLAQNTVQAKLIRDENQTWANSQPPMGDSMASDMKKDWSNDAVAMDSSRPMRMFASHPNKDLSYNDSIKIVSSGLGAIDQGLIFAQFPMRSYADSQIPTVENEKALDAITRYIEGNAKWTEPTRLKYTSLVPHTYNWSWDNNK